MRIVVPIKQVPETSNVKMDPETGTMTGSGTYSVAMNPPSAECVEQCVEIAVTGTRTGVPTGCA